MGYSASKTKLAIFDLDNTLIDGDSDYSWGQFLVEKGLVDADRYQQKNESFYQDYRQGKLNIAEFLRFSLQPLTQHSRSSLLKLRDQFMTSCIELMVLPKAIEQVESHRLANHQLLIITATNRFVTEPIAERFGIKNLLATEPEQKNGRFTGRIVGQPCFQHGKIEHLNTWLAEQKINSAETWFYTDSHNDLPLLEVVNHPIAVDPDEHLEIMAKKRDWQQISLR